jgi:hypothetical protein
MKALTLSPGSPAGLLGLSRLRERPTRSQSAAGEGSRRAGTSSAIPGNPDAEIPPPQPSPASAGLSHMKKSEARSILVKNTVQKRRSNFAVRFRFVLDAIPRPSGVAQPHRQLSRGRDSGFPYAIALPASGRGSAPPSLPHSNPISSRFSPGPGPLCIDSLITDPVSACVGPSAAFC